MTTRYYGFNSLAGAKRSSTVVVDGDTTASRFDSSFVPSAIKVPSTADFLEAGAPFIDGSSSITGTLWLRFDTFQTGYVVNGVMALWLNGLTNAYRIMTTSGTIQMQYWNTGTSAWVNWGSAFTIAANALQTFAVKLALNSAFEIYVGSTLMANSSTVPTNGTASVTACRHRSTNGNAWFSQIMCADYDLRNSNGGSDMVNGEGTYTNGTGAYTDVNEAVLDESTAIALPAVGNKHTFTVPSRTIPGGKQIGTVVFNARGRVSGGVVADGKIMCRSGSTDSASGSKSFNGGYEPRGHAFDNDPNTGTRWTQSGRNAAEFGLQAA